MTHTILSDHPTVENALNSMATHISSEEVYLVGIHRGGAKVADAIQQRLEHAGNIVHRGNLDIGFYRDDLDTIGPNPEVRPSTLPFDIGGKSIWLIDDVLYSGRTIRAAMDELFDYGRPAHIKLAVLFDRGGRQLPIQADCIGIQQQIAENCSVELITTERIATEQVDAKKTDTEQTSTDDWHIEQRQVK